MLVGNGFFNQADWNECWPLDGCQNSGPIKCDQIGHLFERSWLQLFYKRNPILGKIFDYLEKWHILSKTAVATILATLGKKLLPLIPTSAHTSLCYLIKFFVFLLSHCLKFKIFILIKIQQNSFKLI